MSSSGSHPRPVLLCVLDGFGYREPSADNAISVAHMPTWRKLWDENPHALLDASGEAVGLPQGQMGNSEVGHMNLGAGRVVYQDLPLIDRALASGQLEYNPCLVGLISKLKARGGTCHLMGLASPGGVHAHQNHMVALAKVIADQGVPVAVHAFLDGRDVPPQSAVAQIGKLEDDLASIAGVKLATLCGRYFAMDRDKRWDRVEKAYDLLTQGEGARVINAVDAIESSYVDGIYDEFVLPLALDGFQGMKDGDGILFANFRADRAREILSALLMPDFDGFKRQKVVHFVDALGMVEYSETLNGVMHTLFPPKNIANGLGEVVSNAGLRQLRIAETEKYPHVTFFFNGGREEPYAGEERIMVPSPKVATYDLQPEMAACEVTDKVVTAIDGGTFDLIVLNYANPDMVGHTGSLPAAVKAVETVDRCLARVLSSIKRAGGAALITADHGNCELMHNDQTEGPHTAHTLSKVPVVLYGGADGSVVGLHDGRLADVAPTLLSLLGVSKPAEMDGESLIVGA
ncbi:MAG: 2,3-bisphosphoglycerate-independent phosphoglycerate mutase [Alphaproteobacteria bacterium]|nr:2,3-bisphosphoglycerate-independent phosphoglycerate mutase [Alphaproteobacteria bacterium]